MRLGRSFLTSVLVALAAVPAAASAQAPYDETSNWLQGFGQTLTHLTDPQRLLLTAAQSGENLRDTLLEESAKIPRRGLQQTGAWPWSGDPTCATYKNQNRFDGRWRELEFRNPSGQALAATLWAPSDARLSELGLPAPLPAVVYSPGFISSQPLYCWFAAGMANSGYVVMTYDVSGQGKSEGFSTGDAVADLRAALDFFTSPANPFGALVDRSRIGTAGHSMGASAVQTVGSHGGLVKAISAHSDLHSSYKGHVPIQGQGADYDEFIFPPTPTFNTNPAGKLDGFDAARARGVDTQEVVIESASHLAWSHVTGAWTARWSEPVALHYSLAWFDRYLYADMQRGGLSATERLKLSFDAGGGHGLSRKFLSAYSLDGDLCTDQRAGCP